jgi:carbon-monoxide dehydrogenase large subunit
MGQFGIGQPVRRKEDVRLLTGKGRFTDDINMEGQVFACFLRSPHAHAKIVRIDGEALKDEPGIIAVVTGADLLAEDLGTLLCEADFKDRQGKPMYKPLRPVLPMDRVRFVGEPIAMVLAETLEQARDAVERLDVEFEDLPVVVDTASAPDPASAVLWEENGSNVAVHWENREPAEIEGLIRSAPKRVKVEIVNNRVVPSPMEPKAALATYDAGTGTSTLYCPSQGGRRIQNTIARRILKIEPEKMRVISKDTGGGFGIRSKVYPELVCVVWAARKFGRPVKWRGDRSETFVSDYHGRDQVNHAEMGLDEDGRVIALKVETILNVGAYLGENGPRLPINGGGKIIPCAYDIQNFYLSVKPVFTNTVPTDTYRGAGRPEANFLMERLMDAAAEACGLSREEVRRRNLIPQSKLPYKTAMGNLIDSGDFVGSMEMAMKAADWQGFATRRAESEARGKLRGLGLANFIEGAGGPPTEEMRVRLDSDGSATVYAGTYSHGQGHETVYAQLVYEYLGVAPENVRLVQGDTATSPKGAAGTMGSRSSMMGGMGIKRSSTKIIEKGTAIAAHLLQTEPAKVSFSEGCFRVGASSIPLAAVAKAAYDTPGARPRRGELPERLPHLRGRGRSRPRNHRDAELRGRRRLRGRPQPPHRPRPGLWGRGAGHRPSPDRERHLRSVRPARYGHLHGLRDAAGRAPHAHRSAVQRGAVQDQRSRRQGSRGGGGLRGASGPRLRGGRCAEAARRPAYRHAAQPRARLAGHRCRQSRRVCLRLRTKRVKWCRSASI